MNYFYSHLIGIETLTKSLDELDLSDEERLYLADLLDSSLHHIIMDAIFSELSDQDKRKFVHHLTEGDHDKIWNFLNARVGKIEEKIKKAADSLKVELHKDIEEAKVPG